MKLGFLLMGHGYITFYSIVVRDDWEVKSGKRDDRVVMIVYLNLSHDSAR